MSENGLATSHHPNQSDYDPDPDHVIAANLIYI